MTAPAEVPAISVMLIVPDTPAAVRWYRQAFGATNHRQGGFQDPFGHVWSVGDRSPLQSADR